MHGNRVEADVGEEDNCRAGEHPQRLAALTGFAHQGVAEETEPRVAVGRERMPISRIDVEDADADHQQHDAQLNGDHHGIESGTLSYPFDKNHCQNERNHNRRQIEMRPRSDKLPGSRHVIKWSRSKMLRYMQSEQGNEFSEVR